MCREALTNRVGTQLLLHTPAIDLPHNLRFGLVDHQMRWGGDCLPHIRIAIGWIPPVHASLAGSTQPVCPENPSRAQAVLEFIPIYGILCLR